MSRAALLVAALPWAWFLVRGVGAQTEFVAVGIPVVVLSSATVAALWGLLARRATALLVIASLAAFYAVAVFAPRVPGGGPAPADPFRLVAANPYESNPTPEEAARDLLAQGADVLAAVEVPRDVVNGLEGIYPYQIVKNNLAVFSRYPLEPTPRLDGFSRRDVTRVHIDGPDGPFLLYEVHSPQPLHDISLGAHLAFIRALRAKALTEPIPVVIAGDFNMSDRGQGYRLMAASFRDAMRAGWPAATFDKGLWRLFQLRIDYVFTSRSWCGEDPDTFGIGGSDHEGIAVTIGPCSRS